MTSASAQQDWFSAQQKYWDSWFEQQRNFFGAAAPQPAPQAPPMGFQPWADLLKGWQGLVGGNTQATDAQQFQQYFTKAGENYLNMLQQFYLGAGQSKSPEQLIKEWAETLQKSFLGAAQGGKDPFTAMDPMGFFASMPGIGYTREKQEQMNHLYQQWAEFEAKAREYNASMSKVGLEALQKFQAYIANPPQGAAPLTSLKEIYAKWVDICEDIYAKYAMTEEYTKLYGDVVNALMAFKKKQNEVLDDVLGQANMPTRAEVDSLHQRVAELKREIAALKSGKAKAAPAPKGKKK